MSEQDGEQPDIPIDADEIVESESAASPLGVVELAEVLQQMGAVYRANPMAAVRG
jgi:hypothetical protein